MTNKKQVGRRSKSNKNDIYGMTTIPPQQSFIKNKDLLQHSFFLLFP